MQGEKCEKSTQNLQRNDAAQQVEGFCILYFVAFKLKKESNQSFFELLVQANRFPVHAAN